MVGYRVRSLDRTPLNSTSGIKQFVLSKGADIAAICSDEENDNIHFYRRGASGYHKIVLPSLNGGTALTGASIVYGPYEDSDYESYLVLSDANGELQDSIEVLMRNRMTERFFRRTIDTAAIDEDAYET